jgi:hypothetical protein
MLGKTIFETPLSAMNKLSISHLPQGIYLANIVAAGKTVTRKFIIR